MATPDLHGLNILNPAKITAYSSPYHGLARTHDGGDVFTVSGTVSEATTAFSIIYYADTSLSDRGLAVQTFHISGDRIVTGAYGFRNATERAAAVSVSVEVGRTYSETFGVTVSDGGLPVFRAYTYPMIYDRGEVDVYRVRYLREKITAGQATADELAEWSGGLRGAFSTNDWQRIYDAIVDYQAGHPGTSVTAADVATLKAGSIDRAGYISTAIDPPLATLKTICEAIIADGATYPGPQDFGNGKALTYQQANNIERLLSLANS